MKKILDPKKIITKARDLSLDKKNLVIPNQTHSNNVLNINKSGLYEDIDGLISDNKKLILSIRVADCIPLFVYCYKTKYFGLIHCGWRGTKNKIVSNTINKMKFLGSDPKEIKVVIGPSINQCCFEVDLDVSKFFSKNYSKKGEEMAEVFEDSYSAEPLANMENYIISFGTLIKDVGSS